MNLPIISLTQRRDFPLAPRCYQKAICAAAIGCLILTLTSGSAIALTPGLPAFRTVALSQKPAPGLATGIVFNNFDAPSINDAGQVSFRGFLAGTGVVSANNQGLWFERSDLLQLAGRTQTSAPSPSPGQTFFSFEQPYVLDDGQTAFRGYINSSFTASAAWVTSPTGTKEVMGIGFAVPDANGQPLSNYSWNTLTIAAAHSSNLMLLNGIIRHSSGSTTGGFWLVKDNTTRFVVRGDQPAPGAPSSAFQMLDAPVMNRQGQFAFEADLFDPGFGPDLNGGIWTNRSGTLQLLVASGSAATEIGPGVNYYISRQPLGINDSGQIAFRTFLNGGVTGSDDQAIVLDTGGVRRVVAREGQFAPGGGAAEQFDRFDLGDLSINSKGQTAFSAFARGTNVNTTSRNGIWLEESPGQLRAIVRGGMAAPGGNTFDIDRAQPFALNDAGQIAFGASLLGNQGTGIWATDLDGILQLIVRTGSQIEVLPGEFRTVSSISFLHQIADNRSTGGQDGLASAFNNRGEITFKAAFTDGTTGAFVSYAVAVPEPGVLASLWALLACSFRARRSRMKS